MGTLYNASKTIDFVIDKTPPEATISFNTSTKNITVYNNDTKTEANYIILPAKKIKDKDDGNEEDNENNETSWELRQYALQDQANNSFVLILQYKNEGKETKAEIISLQYNNGTTITANDTRIEAEYSVDKNGTIKELEQKIKTSKDSEIEAKYSLKKNQTEIKTGNEKQEEKKETRPGLVILEIITDKGNIKYLY